MRAGLIVGVAMLGVIPWASVPAQPYPSKAIRFVTVGGDDVVPRLVAQTLSGQLGQQVFIDEHAGASGTIGAEVGARAPADGYNFLVATSSHMVTHHFFKVSYDIQRDFEPVSLLASYPFVLLAHPSLPVRSVAELIKIAKAQPGKLNYSSTSAGSPTMLTFEMFKANARIQIVHVPYKSIGAALTDLIAGHVELNLGVLPSALPQIQANRVRALAVSTPGRSAALPDVPSFVEQGLPTVVSVAWAGVLAPAKTPPAAIARMHAEIVKALNRPEVRERILGLSMEPGGNSPDEFRSSIKAELVKWAHVVKEAKIPTTVHR